MFLTAPLEEENFFTHLETQRGYGRFALVRHGACHERRDQGKQSVAQLGLQMGGGVSFGGRRPPGRRRGTTSNHGSHGFSSVPVAFDIPEQQQDIMHGERQHVVPGALEPVQRGHCYARVLLNSFPTPVAGTGHRCCEKK
jgi:hypothetical protein